MPPGGKGVWLAYLAPGSLLFSLRFDMMCSFALATDLAKVQTGPESPRAMVLRLKHKVHVLPFKCRRKLSRKPFG